MVRNSRICTTNSDNDVITLLSWTPQDILFNLAHPKPAHVINLLIVCVKQYLYRQRCFVKKPFTPNVIAEFEQLYNIEYGIAKSKGKLRQHIDKWMAIKPGLSLSHEQLQQQDDFIALYINNM